MVERAPGIECGMLVGNVDHLHVFADGHRSVGLGDMKRPSDPELPDLARTAADNLDAVEPNRTRVRSNLAIQDIEAGRFTCPVRTDQCNDLPALHFEAYIGDGVDTAIGFCNPRDE